ncbi:hypothetical protein N7517_006276 [Penicillium concentricum]|uniref:CFEM domain-containing protein n=1 Tax=Penicillium concentricum TaxID=293559 RepID=A0A9W9S9F6_9EURO|nr:uncharacterized protein N7517_006276 [Penicillium concentricum]KAJ5374270.1 hypothetical protein N7517_006276 [Penicillium concentricum]
MKLTIFFPLAAFLTWTVADCLDEPSACLTKCINEAAGVAGCSATDYVCTCPSTAFKDTLGACMKASCTAEDITAAGELHKERCGSAPE